MKLFTDNKVFDLLKKTDLFNVKVNNFPKDYDLNTFKVGIGRDADLSLKNKPTDIDVYALYFAINVDGWGTLQFAFPAQTNAVYYRSAAPNITAWKQIGGIQRPANPLVTMLCVPSEMEVA